MTITISMDKLSELVGRLLAKLAAILIKLMFRLNERRMARA